MTDHTTPRPWKVTYNPDNPNEVWSIDGTLELEERAPWPNGKEHIVETDSGCYGPVKADAELIVRAVNRDQLFDQAQEALEDALHDLLAWANTYPAAANEPDPLIERLTTNVVISEIEAALAAMKGGEAK